MSTNDADVCVALRGALVAPQSSTSEQALQLLVESAEWVLFNSALLAPTQSLVHRALDSIAVEADWTSFDDERLEDTWRQAIEQSAVHYRNEPERWVDAASLRFKENCADTFGVEAEVVPRLIRQFHSLSMPERYGVLRMVQRSTAFGYVRLGFTSGRQASRVADPDESFRRLIRSTFGDL